MELSYSNINIKQEYINIDIKYGYININIKQELYPGSKSYRESKFRLHSHERFYVSILINVLFVIWFSI